MAWISVHDQVLGWKLRELAKSIGCSQNEALGLLVRFWLWCVNNADSQGYIVGATLDDIKEALSVGREPSLNVNRIVGALIEGKWLDVSADEIFVHDWEDWQKAWFKYCKTIESNNERQKRFRQKRSENSEAEPIVTPKAKTKKEKDGTEKEPKSEYTSGFEEFWKAYPRKTGKGEAYKKYKARLNDGFKPDVLLEAAINYSNICKREHTEEKFIKHGKTFLSETLPFEDYLHKEQQEITQPDIDDGKNPFGNYKR